MIAAKQLSRVLGGGSFSCVGVADTLPSFCKDDVVKLKAWCACMKDSASYGIDTVVEKKVGCAWAVLCPETSSIPVSCDSLAKKESYLTCEYGGNMNYDCNTQRCVSFP